MFGLTWDGSICQRETCVALALIRVEIDASVRPCGHEGCWIDCRTVFGQLSVSVQKAVPDLVIKTKIISWK